WCRDLDPPWTLPAEARPPVVPASLWHAHASRARPRLQYRSAQERWAEQEFGGGGPGLGIVGELDHQTAQYRHPGLGCLVRQRVQVREEAEMPAGAAAPGVSRDIVSPGVHRIPAVKAQVLTHDRGHGAELAPAYPELAVLAPPAESRGV